MPLKPSHETGPLDMTALLVIPWVFPFASGPSALVQPWLAAALCTAGLVTRASFAGLRSAAIPTAWLAAALLSAGMAILQYFGSVQALGPWVNQTVPGEAWANLRQPNLLASLTSIGLLSLWWHAAQGRLGVQVWWMGPLLALSNAASGSRTGLAQWLCILLLVLIAARRRATAVVAWSVAVYLLAVLVLPMALQAWTGDIGRTVATRWGQDLGCSSRKVLWANMLQLVAQKPWLGWGWGELDYAHYITLYPGARFCAIVDNAHNLPLHIAVEWGVPAALTVCALLGWGLWRGRPWRETDATRQLAWGVLAIVGLHSLVEFPLWYGPFQTAAGLCAWLLWRKRGASSGFHVPNRPEVRFAGSFIAMLSIPILVYAAWDYQRISQIYLPPEARSTSQPDPWVQARASWLFADQVRFAELTTTALTPDNAREQLARAQQLLHFSPEPRVIERVIDSAELLNLQAVARMHEQRFQAAFPAEHAAWRLRRQPTPDTKGTDRPGTDAQASATK